MSTVSSSWPPQVPMAARTRTTRCGLRSRHTRMRRVTSSRGFSGTAGSPSGTCDFLELADGIGVGSGGDVSIVGVVAGAADHPAGRSATASRRAWSADSVLSPRHPEVSTADPVSTASPITQARRGIPPLDARPPWRAAAGAGNLPRRRRHRRRGCGPAGTGPSADGRRASRWLLHPGSTGLVVRPHHSCPGHGPDCGHRPGRGHPQRRDVIGAQCRYLTALSASDQARLARVRR